MPLGMRDTIAQKVRTLLTDLTDNELTLMPGAIRDEVQLRVDRARRDVERAARELESKTSALGETLKRFEVAP